MSAGETPTPALAARVEALEAALAYLRPIAVRGDAAGYPAWTNALGVIDRALSAPPAAAATDGAEGVREDAERWRALIECERVRVLGSARLGQPDAHIGVELWGVFPQPDARSVWRCREELTRFVDGLRATPLPKCCHGFRACPECAALAAPPAAPAPVGDPCEGCARAPATREDGAGVRLCAACWETAPVGEVERG